MLVQCKDILRSKINHFNDVEIKITEPLYKIFLSSFSPTLFQNFGLKFTPKYSALLIPWPSIDLDVTWLNMTSCLLVWNWNMMLISFMTILSNTENVDMDVVVHGLAGWVRESGRKMFLGFFIKLLPSYVKLKKSWYKIFKKCKNELAAKGLEKRGKHCNVL